MQRKKANWERQGSKGKNRCRKLRGFVGVLWVLAATCLLFSPELADWLTRKRAEEVRIEVQIDAASDESVWDESQEAMKGKDVPDNDMAELSDSQADAEDNEEVLPEEAASVDSIRERIQAYNEGLCDSDQKEQIERSKKTDVWDEDRVFGTLQIPGIHVDLPMYVGATEENLSRGAAVLEGTSLPVGGESTHSVLSGHRGWRGAAYFKEIEAVSWGDEILLTNPWETLTYTVVGMDIIEPSEIDSLLIQEGRDRITIVTCHPYQAPRNMRYVIYAERSTGEITGGNSPVASAPGITSSEERLEEARQYEANKERLLEEHGSSSQEIQRETLFRCGVGMGIWMLLFLILSRRKKHKPGVF